jgi:hypothetical protein
MSSSNEPDSLAELDALLSYAETQLESLAKQTQLERVLAGAMPDKFAENMQAFSKYLPKIADQFRDYQPNSMQFFCAKSGVANIIDEQLGSALYDDDPIAQCRAQVDDLIANPQFTSLAFSLDEEVTNNFIHTKYMTEIYDLFLEQQKKLAPLTTIPEHLGSMVIFGIGLGYHLTHLLNDITIDHLYICEPNKDLFFASLYTCDWKYILETIDQRDGYIYLNLGVKYQDFTADFINELKDKGSFNAVNSVLYQHYPSESLTDIIRQFSHDFHMVTIGWGFFDDGVISIAHDFANAQQRVPVLKKQAQLPRNWRAVPAFVVANGPSLDHAIDVIKAYQGKAIIFSCGSVLQSLLNQGITPDFHLEIERTKFTYDYLKEFIDNEAMKKINFLTGNVMHPECMQLFKWTGIGFKATEASTIIACDFMDRNENFAQLKFCNPVVANTGLAFACYMGFEEVYLFGVDSGYKDPTHHHSKHSLYYTDDGQEKQSIGNLVRSGEIEVEGNFGGKVFSTAFFNTGRFYLESLLYMFPKVNCYNCSDGAKVSNAIPVYPDDVMLSSHLPDKHQVIDYIKSELYMQRNFTEQAYLDWLAIDKFAEVCDALIGYIDKEFTSRAEIAAALMQQVRYLFSYALTRYRHIYFLLEGSITYIHSVFRMMLYGFADEQATVACLKQAFEVFKIYMTKAKEKYRGVITAIDEQECYLMDLFKEGVTSDKVSG